MSGSAAARHSASEAVEVIANVARPSRRIVRIHLVGPMRATTYLGENVLPRSKKARAILALLCLASGDPVPRAHLAAVLWDEVSTSHAKARLRHALNELCLAAGPLAEELIAIDRTSVSLNTAACWVDALALLQSSSPDSERSDLAVLCAGNLLEELTGVSPSFDAWVLAERTRFNERLRAVLDAGLRDIDRAGGDTRHVAALARRLIAFDATHEGASRALIRACPDEGSLPRDHVDARRSAPARSRLRVGVLRFEGTWSANEETLAFSLSHEIAAALARFRWFDVITPISMARRSLSNFVADGLQRHQLDYAVDGTITRNGKLYQISARLLDLARDAHPVWSDRFELETGELHRLSDKVIAPIVGSIDPVILFIEGQLPRKEHYGATGLLLLAIPLIYSMERKRFEQAGELIGRALEIEPNNAMAVTLAAYWHLWHVGQRWTLDAGEKLDTVEALCLRALKLDPDNSDALGIYAHTLSWKRKFDAAVDYFDRSLRVNPNLAYIWALSAATYCYVGEPDEALRRLSRYRDLAPFDPYFGFFENAYTMAYAFKRDYERAAVVGRRVVKANPGFINAYKPLIVALGHLGLRDEARRYIDKVMSLEPDFTVKQFNQLYPFKFAHDRENYSDGLRLAGVPEG